MAVKTIALKGKTATIGFVSLAFARIGLGFTFFWAFLDKLNGWGFATCRNASTGEVSYGCAQAWVNGGSPTDGFLLHATQGPFAGAFQSLAGQTWVDWLFMLGLLGIGVSLLLGIAVRMGAVAGAILLFLMWLAALWPANNPVIDDHIIYIFVLGVIAAFARYIPISFGPWWQKLPVVRKLPWLV